MRQLDSAIVKKFQETVIGFYKANGRVLPWRQPEPDSQFDPYKIMVSELMLQQTQVPRVVPKYAQFLEQFPDIKSLAKAELKDVLTAWSGLGYNRRAKFLWQAAQTVQSQFNSEIPTAIEELIKLPGVGHNTAAAICVYAYNQPVIFIETNIRTVYIHHFFNDQTGIMDKDILNLVAQTLPQKSAREWYWALMDYGSHLKATVGNLNVRAKTYAKQSKFRGSKRQIRGKILRVLGSGPSSLIDLKRHIVDERLDRVCEDLVQEGLIHENEGVLHLG